MCAWHRQEQPPFDRSGWTITNSFWNDPLIDTGKEHESLKNIRDTDLVFHFIHVIHSFCTELKGLFYSVLPVFWNCLCSNTPDASKGSLSGCAVRKPLETLIEADLEDFWNHDQPFLSCVTLMHTHIFTSCSTPTAHSPQQAVYLVASLLIQGSQCFVGHLHRPMICLAGSSSPQGSQLTVWEARNTTHF